MNGCNGNFRVKSGDFEFFFTDDELNRVDIIRISHSEFNILLDHRSVNVKVIGFIPVGKRVKIEIQGESYEVEISDPLDQLLEKMGYQAGKTRLAKEVKAPMPGLVREVAVQPGQDVKAGDRLLILEAMKMENAIIVPADAKIKSITVQNGQPVEKGQVLVELE